MMSHLIWIYSVCLFNIIQFELNIFGNFAGVILLCAFLALYEFFSHTFVEKIKKSMNLLPVCKLYPTLLALLSHTASSVANAG